MNKKRLFFLLLGSLMAVLDPAIASDKKKKKDTLAPAPEIIERSRLPDAYQASAEQDQQLAKRLADASQAGEITWLTAQNQDSFLSLMLNARTPKSEGIWVFVRNASEHANWPGFMQATRLKLPDDGWATLSLGLPELSSTSDPIFLKRSAPVIADTPKDKDKKKKTSKSKKADNPAQAPIKAPEAPTPTQAELTERWETLALSRIQAAITHARSSQPGKLILAAKGRTAQLILNKCHFNTTPIDALVLLDKARPGNNHPNTTEQPSLPKLPILEIITPSLPHPQARLRQSQNQKRAATFANIPYRILHNPSIRDRTFDEDGCLRRLRGWIRRTF